MRRWLGIAGFCIACWGAAGQAADMPFEFEDPAQEARYLQLIDELRCLVCQNQSLADSHADLAQDLRNEVYRMVSGGQSNDEIIGFLVQRYGDFVRYRPPVKETTWLLWFGPLLLLLAAAFAWVRLSRARRRAVPPLTDAERAHLQSLVDRTPGIDP